MGYLNTNHEKRVAALKSNKEKYKARLQETAEIWTLQPAVLLENYRRCVRRQRRHDEAVARLHDRSPRGRTLQDRRASVDRHVLDGALERPDQPDLHKSILNNVDFQYIYDYFFDPAKVKGQPYKPLRSPSFTEAVVVGKSSEAAAKNAADPAVAFFEDFSSSAVGKKPLNWRQHAG